MMLGIRTKLLILVGSMAFSLSYGQECKLLISGYIYDQFTLEPLPATHILVEETGDGAVADTSGFFSFQYLCKGEYHLHISHLRCEPIHQYVKLTADTLMNFYLEHHSEYLDEITISGKPASLSLQTSSTLSAQELQQNSGENLSRLVEKVTGISSIKNGSGIAKPVIHGLYGNRISIVNHGLIQAGQNWGNDHAPEIDPFSANRISVIKGVGTIRYGGNGLGGMIVVDQDRIPPDPHVHGSAHYAFRSNGRGHSLATLIEQGGKSINWRFTGSLKYGGDHRSPDYFLTNTGVREKNIALKLNSTLGKKWFNELYYSLFNTELGILRGSHIGNLTDLTVAIKRDTPLFTESRFSYHLTAPKQQVTHHLLRATSKYFLDNNRYFEFSYGSQLNLRSEFDVRRSGRSDVPALKLSLFSQFLEATFSAESKKRKTNTGIQYRYQSNKNGAETGILPLIPDYQLFNPGVFFLKTWYRDQVNLELGGRYDLHYLKIVLITSSRILERRQHQFHNIAFSSALSFQKKSTFKGKINVGYVLRSPEINELYSLGLHQGVSGIEEGNPELNAESGFKIILNGVSKLSSKIYVEASVYSHFIQNYIYLEPLQEFRLTIRGAFPVFLYNQTNATLAGGDLSIKVEPIKELEWSTRYSIIRGQDLLLDRPLVYIPSDEISSQITWSIGNSLLETEPRVGVRGAYKFRQTKQLESQDFLAPPPGYFLLGCSFETELPILENHFNLSIQVENILNTRYRDYLDRLRYYSDAEGRNVILRLHYKF